jgi:calcineurin-like phosphoesterase family protein
MANKNQTNSYLDTNGVSKYVNYLNPSKDHNFDSNSLNTSNIFNSLSRVNTTSEFDLSKLNSLTDSKNFNNPLKYELSTKGSKTHLAGTTNISSNNTHEFETFNNSLSSNINHLNNNVSYIFEDLKSGNQSLLPTERTVRLTDKLNPQKNLNTDDFNKNSTSVNDIYSSLSSNNTSYTDLNRFTNTSTTFPLGHNPVLSSNPSVKDLSFDRTFTENAGPALLQSKEESAPNIIFETY